MTIRPRAYPSWKDTIPVPIDKETAQKAEGQIDSCEACNPDVAEVPFDYVLDSITGCDPEVSDYVLSEPAHCPRCGGEVRTGYWRWYTNQKGERMVFILPGTLVTLKK
jgi:hypothetical protein